MGFKEVPARSNPFNQRQVYTGVNIYGPSCKSSQSHQFRKPHGELAFSKGGSAIGVSSDFGSVKIFRSKGKRSPESVLARIVVSFNRYSSGRRGERDKLAAHSAKETESDYRSEFRKSKSKSAWAACIKRIYEVEM